jgi:hypothetical protein
MSKPESGLDAIGIETTDVGSDEVLVSFHAIGPNSVSTATIN